METVFLSYSSKDDRFAELVQAKLSDAGINVWRDQDQLRPGDNWRDGIDKGIINSFAILVALSPNSVESSYVTYEWSYALGKGKTIIPMKLSECKFHLKLEPIQYIDFSVGGDEPWGKLITRIREIETEQEANALVENINVSDLSKSPNDVTLKSILSYLEQRGYQMISFERARQRINGELTDEILSQLVVKNPTVFRFATVRNGKPGLAKLIS